MDIVARLCLRLRDARRLLRFVTGVAVLVLGLGAVPATPAAASIAPAGAAVRVTPGTVAQAGTSPERSRDGSAVAGTSTVTRVLVVPDRADRGTPPGAAAATAVVLAAAVGVLRERAPPRA